VQVVLLVVAVVSFEERFDPHESENWLRKVVSEPREEVEEVVHREVERCSRYLLRKDRQPVRRRTGLAKDSMR